MMISIGYKHFIESDYIVEILKASNARAGSIMHLAAISGMLINAVGERKVRSIIKLKSNHIVLSALRAETLTSRLGDRIIFSVPGNSDMVDRIQKSNDANMEKGFKICSTKNC